MTQHFGFAQFDLAGTLPLADGRYLARDEAGSEEAVLVVETLGAPPLPGRRRRRPAPSEAGEPPPRVSLTRVTVVRAAEPFDDPEEAQRWLSGALASEEAVDALAEAGVALLNRAMFAQATASADPRLPQVAADDAEAVRLGHGSGEQVAAGRYAAAQVVDVRAAGGSRRRRRAEELRPQERVAAVLGGRERIDACEPLLLRARADLDAGRAREAALQLRVALEALLVELDGALSDPAHDEDMATLGSRRSEAGEVANAALSGNLDPDTVDAVAELIQICERVLRRRRVLRGG